VEEVVGAGGGETDRSGGVMLGKPVLEFTANIGLDGGRVFERELGYVDDGGRFRRFGGDIVDGGDDALGVEMPFGEKAIRGQSAMQRAGGDAVKIGDIRANKGAEAIQIEVRVAGFERVEGPFDETDIARKGFLALEEFEGAAHFAITVLGQNAGHVGMEIGCAVADSGESYGEADHGVALEGPKDLAAGVMGNDESDVGLGFEFGFAPDEFLEFDAAVELGERRAFADLDGRGHEEADS